MTVLEWLSDYGAIVVIMVLLGLFLVDNLHGWRQPQKKQIRTPAEDAEREMFLRSYQYKYPAPPEFHDNYRKPK